MSGAGPMMLPWWGGAGDAHETDEQQCGAFTLSQCPPLLAGSWGTAELQAVSIGSLPLGHSSVISDQSS